MKMKQPQPLLTIGRFSLTFPCSNSVIDFQFSLNPSKNSQSLRILQKLQLQLALQLLSNKTANREIARHCKSIVHDQYPSKFGNILKKELDVNKALFLINFLEIGKRKYTQLRQHLLSSEIHFPAYHKLVEQRNSIITANHPNVSQPYKPSWCTCTLRTICPPYILQNTINYTTTINSRFSVAFPNS